MRRRPLFLAYFKNFGVVFQRSSLLVTCKRQVSRVGCLRTVCLVALLGLTVFACFLHVASITSILFCLNWKTELAVRELCQNYKAGCIAGNLCEDLCSNHQVTVVSCYIPHLAKDIVFAGKWRDRNVVIKTMHSNISVYDPFPFSSISSANANLSFSLDVFWQIINDIININYKLDFKKYYLLQPNGFLQTILVSDFVSALNAKTNEVPTSVLLSIWLLAQQKEYLTFKLFQNSGLFPRIYGSCGHFYAMERLTPLSDLLYTNWQARIELTIKILNLLEDVEYRFPYPLRVCDMKLIHFGVDERRRMKILDGDDVYFQNVLDSIVLYNNRCRWDHECSFFDCKMKCNYSTHTCDTKKINHNLQAACEKMLIEPTISEQLFKPNLMHSLPSKMSTALMPLLKSCAALTEMSGSSESFSTLKEKIVKFLMST